MSVWTRLYGYLLLVRPFCTSQSGLWAPWHAAGLSLPLHGLAWFCTTWPAESFICSFSVVVVLVSVLSSSLSKPYLILCRIIRLLFCPEELARICDHSKTSLILCWIVRWLLCPQNLDSLPEFCFFKALPDSVLSRRLFCPESPLRMRALPNTSRILCSAFGYLLHGRSLALTCTQSCVSGGWSDSCCFLARSKADWICAESCFELCVYGDLLAFVL